MVFQKKKKSDEETDDWIIRSLDLLSPFDADFISDHLRRKTKSEIEYRLNDIQFRREAAEFKKIPTFVFEIIFIRDRVVAHKCLMLLTAAEVSDILKQSTVDSLSIFPICSLYFNQIKLFVYFCDTYVSCLFTS